MLHTTSLRRLTCASLLDGPENRPRATYLNMAFTMHSHSGQFCPGHAVDQLEDILKHAISIGYKTIGLTEHMPRYHERDLYPEEVSLAPGA